eukprot:1017735-Amphidinium_carterae.2
MKLRRTRHTERYVSIASSLTRLIELALSEEQQQCEQQQCEQHRRHGRAKRSSWKTAVCSSPGHLQSHGSGSLRGT